MRCAENKRRLFMTLVSASEDRKKEVLSEFDSEELTQVFEAVVLEIAEWRSQKGVINAKLWKLLREIAEEGANIYPIEPYGVMDSNRPNYELFNHLISQRNCEIGKKEFFGNLLRDIQLARNKKTRSSFIKRFTK